MLRKSLMFILLIIILTGDSYNSFALLKININGSKKNNGKTSFAQYYGKVSITPWADGKKSAYSFSFDDGFMSQYTYARPILNQFGFHGTFYVIAGSLTDTLSPIWRYGFWWQFKEMAAEGHEIGAHTMTHPDLTMLPVGDTLTPKTVTYELHESKKIIEEKIPGQKCVSFAYPYCAEDSTVENVAAKYFISARGCGTFADGPDIEGSTWYNLASTDIPFNKPRTRAGDLNILTQYENKVQSESIDLGKWTILMGHEMFPFAQLDTISNDYYPMTTEWFTALCQWIKQKSDDGELWVETVGNISRYTKERENFYYNVTSQDDSKIEIEPMDGLDNSIFNYPLTADITVPESWDTVSVSQDNKITVTRTFTENGATVIRANIIPGGGMVTITPGASSLFTLSGKIIYDNTEKSPINNVIITLQGPNGVINSMTGNNGDYSFKNLVPGKYKVTLSKTDGWGGANSIDALMIQRYDDHQVSLDSLQMLSADVNNDGKIDDKDVQMIKERFLKKINVFTKPNWIFPENITITISNSNVTENIKGIAAGDVNKSYIP